MKPFNIEVYSRTFKKPKVVKIPKKNSFKGIQQYKTFKSAPNHLARPLPPLAILPKYGAS